MLKIFLITQGRFAFDSSDIYVVCDMFTTKEILQDWNEVGFRHFQESNNDFVIRQHGSKEQLIYATHIINELELFPDLERIDLGCPVAVYDYFFDYDKFRQEKSLKYARKQFNLYAASLYGTDSPVNIRKRLHHKFAPAIVNVFKDTKIPFQKIDIAWDEAVSNMHKLVLIPNQTMRFVNNKFYTGKPTSVNAITGKERSDKTFQSIYEYLCDYDLNYKITHKRIANDLSISERTVRRYLKEITYLKDLYQSIKK